MATWWVSDVGYRLAQEVLQPIDETVSLITDGADETTIEIGAIEPDPLGAALWVVVNAAPGGNDPVEHLTLAYDPLDQGALHREFSKLEIKVPSILEFINEFGFLGRRTERLVPARIPGEEVQASEHTYLGESLEYWGTQIFKLDTLIKIWDLYRNPSQEATARMAQMLEIEGDEISIRQEYVSECDDDPMQLRAPTIDWDWDSLETDLEGLPPTSDPAVRLRMGARLLIRDAVNEELRKGSYASIDVKDGSSIFLVPKDLLGALYVLFAQELVGKSVPAIQCSACSSYFVPQHGKQMYCDDRCKFKAYRQRKQNKEKTHG